MNKAVYFFCMDENIDPVASKVFSYVQRNNDLLETNLTIDEFSVLEYKKEHVFQFVRLNNVLSHDYIKYLPFLNKYFADYNIAGVVNWHEGTNAPDRILTVHSTGDVPSGCFGKSNPHYFKNLICSLEQTRIKYGLENFKVMTEATHWSGIPYKQSPELITKYNVPVYDIEIGSTLESWNNETAIKILSESLFDVFNENSQLKTLVCVGGIHFEEAYSNILLDKHSVSIGHILANQWIIGNYLDKDGKEKLNKCIESIIGGINGIIFHDNLKGEYKQQCREIAEEHNIYVGKHKILKTPEELIKHLK
jgi:D-tyrosyl-tRNA(Tyr) deacylase